MYKQNFVATIKCNGRILREHENDVVYLPFNTEYSILLKNKDSRKASVNIEVDGKDVLNGNSLIVKGNESQELKGFMSDMSNTNRFKFINKTEDISKYRGDKIDDGLIKVSFQFEKHKPDPVIINSPQWYYNPDIRYRGFGDQYGFSSTTVKFTSSSNYCNAVVTDSCNDGITVKGSKINQNYSYGNIDSLEPNIHTIVLHLKGETINKKEIHKPITIRSKLKCSTCGRENKSMNKFCHNCGTFLD